MELLKTSASMSVAHNLQALSAAVAVAGNIPATVENTIELTAALNNIQQVAHSILASVPSMTSAEKCNVRIAVIGALRPLRASNSQLYTMYTDGMKAFFATNVNTHVAFEHLLRRFLSPNRIDHLKPYTVKVFHKVFQSMLPIEVSRRFPDFNIPVHANNFAAGLVTGGLVMGGAPTDRQKCRLFRLLDEYLANKRQLAHQRYRVRPEVAPLLALINKFLETIASITNVTSRIVQLGYQPPSYVHVHQAPVFNYSAVDTDHWSFGGHFA
jgi:hypothetical protein